MRYSLARDLRTSGVLLLAALAGAGCTFKGIQTNTSHDGGADAGGRDGGKKDVRGPDAVGGGSTAGNTNGAAGASGGAGGFIVSFSSLVGGGGTTATGGSQTGGTPATGGTRASSGGTRDGGVVDAYRPDAKDAAGGSGGSKSKIDAYVPDAYRPDAWKGGAGGSSSTSAAAGTGGGDAWIPDAPVDAYLPDAAIDTPMGGSGGGSGGTGGTGGASSATTMPALHIYSFNVSSGSTSGDEITVTAGKSVTFLWDVSGATTKEIDREVGMVTGTSKTITAPNPSTETTYTYTLTVTNSTNDASTDFDQAHAEVKLTVVPLAITSFTASPSAVNSGESSTLTAAYAGTPSIEDDLGNAVGGLTITDGGLSVTVTPSRPTTYRLTVGNRLGDSVHVDTTVNVLGLDAGP